MQVHGEKVVGRIDIQFTTFQVPPIIGRGGNGGENHDKGIEDKPYR